MTLVESLAFSMAPANKSVVIKTMMRRFQISDPAVGRRGIRTILPASSGNRSRAWMGCETSGD